VIATAAVHVGGRLQVVDMAGGSSGSDPARPAGGFDWHKGDVIDVNDLDKVAETMADELVAALMQRPLPPEVAHLYLTDPILDFGRIDGIMFSGGVGEYVYGREARDFGDMGRRLGSAIRNRVFSGKLPWPLLPAGECIRATALGASEYSVQLSGNTSYISKPGELLPRRNLQVLQPNFACEGRDRCGGARERDPRAFHRLRPDRGRRRGGAGAALAGGAVLRADRGTG
jgi:ethanolamine utilization protein EutA